MTSVQTLIDVRNQLDRYTTPEVVQWHIASVNNRWTKRALASAGFGYPTLPTEEYSRWKPIFNITEIGGANSAAAAAEREMNRRLSHARDDLEIARPTSSKNDHQIAANKLRGDDSSSGSNKELQRELSNSKAYHRSTSRKVAVVHSLNRPLFHIDLTSALESAITNVQAQESLRAEQLATPKDQDFVDDIPIEK